MSTNSVTLHRVLKTTPEKVYRAFTDANAMASWLPPYGYLCVVQQRDFKAGGEYHMSFTNFSTGNSHSFGGKFIEIKPNELLRYSDKFDDPSLPGEMITTILLKKVLCGTDLQIIQENIPAAIPAETFLIQTEVIISSGKFGSSNLSVYFKNSFGFNSKYFPPKECPLPVVKLIKDIL